LQLRRDVRALASHHRSGTTAVADEAARVLVVHREADGDAVIVVLAFGDGDAPVTATVEVGRDRWRVLLDSHAGSTDAAVPAVVAAAERGDVVQLSRPARSVLLLRRSA
jgi:uncharacterized protein DUF3459